MGKPDPVKRTVQYWRLVDARDRKGQKEMDWNEILGPFLNKRQRHLIGGKEYSGTVKLVKIKPEWQRAFDISDVPGVTLPPNPTHTYGIVLAAEKDYVPNQEELSSGDQKAMTLAGEDWSPVDNLFVWHLPFGNMIGVLAESTSSSRAGKYADWLTKATKDKYQDPEFAWAAVPVIDQSRTDLFKTTRRITSFVYAGYIGSEVHDAVGIRDLFLGPKKKNPGAIRIEIKASLVRGKSHPDLDEGIILDLFQENFGSLEGDVKKAQITLPGGNDEPPSEIDLLHHRLTRKTKVELSLGATSAFTLVSAVGAIVESFLLDRADLLRLRSSPN